MDLSSSAVSSSSFEDVGEAESCRWTGADAGSVSNFSELGNMSEAVSDISGGGEVSDQDMAERMKDVELNEPNDDADGQGKGQGSSSRGKGHSGKIKGYERFYEGRVLRVETEML